MKNGLELESPEHIKCYFLFNELGNSILNNDKPSFTQNFHLEKF